MELLSKHFGWAPHQWIITSTLELVQGFHTTKIKHYKLSGHAGTLSMWPMEVRFLSSGITGAEFKTKVKR